MKKVLSILIAFLLVFSAFSIVSYATSSEGEPVEVAEEVEENTDEPELNTEAEDNSEPTTLEQPRNNEAGDPVEIDVPTESVNPESPSGENDFSSIFNISVTIAAEPQYNTTIGFNLVNASSKEVAGTIVLSEENGFKDGMLLKKGIYQIEGVVGDSDKYALSLKTDKLVIEKDDTFVIEYEESLIEEPTSESKPEENILPQQNGIYLDGANTCRNIYVSLTGEDGKQYNLHFKKSQKYILPANTLSPGNYKINSITTKRNDEFGFSPKEETLTVYENGTGVIHGELFIKENTVGDFFYNNWLLIVLIIASFAVFIGIRKKQGLPVFESSPLEIFKQIRNAKKNK